MPHVKTFCRYGMTANGPCLSWLYIGSHNLSKSAWGEVQKSGTQICVRSYEMGVLFFPSRLASLEKDSKKGFFLKPRSSTPNPNVVLVPSGRASSSDAPIALPTAVPPADAPAPNDLIWSRDWSADVYDACGLDRFGTKFWERGAEFYGYRALVRRERSEREKVNAADKGRLFSFFRGVFFWNRTNRLGQRSTVSHCIANVRVL